jgi:hypothetical protein
LTKIIYLFILSLLIISGCSEDNERKIVGTWQETNNPKGLLEFRSDHTGLAYSPDQTGKQDSSEIKWQILKGEQKLSVITPSGPVNFEIKPDQLVAPNGIILKKIIK